MAYIVAYNMYDNTARCRRCVFRFSTQVTQLWKLIILPTFQTTTKPTEVGFS